MKNTAIFLMVLATLGCEKQPKTMVMGRLGYPIETSLTVHGQVVYRGKTMTEYFQVERVNKTSLEIPILLGLFNVRNPHPLPIGPVVVRGYEYKQWHGAPNTKAGGSYSDQFVITKVLKQQKPVAQPGNPADAATSGPHR